MKLPPILRALSFRTKIRKRKNENPEVKMFRALERIGANSTEIQKINGLYVQARMRANQRTLMQAKGKLWEDKKMIELSREAESILGKKRADKFFAMCNNPRF